MHLGSILGHAQKRHDSPAREAKVCLFVCLFVSFFFLFWEISQPYSCISVTFCTKKCGAKHDVVAWRNTDETTQVRDISGRYGEPCWVPYGTSQRAGQSWKFIQTAFRPLGLSPQELFLGF